jgi:hypothetical protein
LLFGEASAIYVSSVATKLALTTAAVALSTPEGEGARLNKSSTPASGGQQSATHTICFIVWSVGIDDLYV